IFRLLPEGTLEDFAAPFADAGGLVHTDGVLLMRRDQRLVEAQVGRCRSPRSAAELFHDADGAEKLVQLLPERVARRFGIRSLVRLKLRTIVRRGLGLRRDAIRVTDNRDAVVHVNSWLHWMEGGILLW